MSYNSKSHVNDHMALTIFNRFLKIYTSQRPPLPHNQLNQVGRNAGQYRACGLPHVPKTPLHHPILVEVWR